MLLYNLLTTAVFVIHISIVLDGVKFREWQDLIAMVFCNFIITLGAGVLIALFSTDLDFKSFILPNLVVIYASTSIFGISLCYKNYRYFIFQYLLTYSYEAFESMFEHIDTRSTRTTKCIIYILEYIKSYCLENEFVITKQYDILKTLDGGATIEEAMDIARTRISRYEDLRVLAHYQVLAMEQHLVTLKAGVNRRIKDSIKVEVLESIKKFKEIRKVDIALKK
jgi:hypothetical protein